MPPEHEVNNNQFRANIVVDGESAYEEDDVRELVLGGHLRC